MTSPVSLERSGGCAVVGLGSKAVSGRDLWRRLVSSRRTVNIDSSLTGRTREEECAFWTPGGITEVGDAGDARHGPWEWVAADLSQ